MVQEKLKRHCANRSKIRSSHPFANRIICGDCGSFYGHKVWHNRSNTERYDVWYCNHRYHQGETCRTPFLREDEIKAAFSVVLSQKNGVKAEYSEQQWRSQVESVTVYSDRTMKFLFSDGTEVTAS